MHRVPVVDAEEPGTYDLVIVCLRAEDLPGALPVIDAMGAPTVVPMMHLADQLDLLTAHVGSQRLVRAFPGLGGRLTDDGAVEWLAVGKAQPTTVDGRAPRADEVMDVLRRGGPEVVTTEDMDSWTATHEVFIAALGAAVVRAGGDPAALARDRSLLVACVEAVRSGLRVLRASGAAVEPAPVRILFLRMPRWFAVAYWRRAFPGPIGRVTIAPHVWRSRDDEMPVLWRRALELTDWDPPMAALLEPLGLE
ncbi:MAG: hypothetical protein Q4F53_06610 [Nesterenkonia sp.]|nr:hypothetical protein [Nesterenkonia sp.]